MAEWTKSKVNVLLSKFLCFGCWSHSSKHIPLFCLFAWNRLLGYSSKLLFLENIIVVTYENTAPMVDPGTTKEVHVSFNLLLFFIQHDVLLVWSFSVAGASSAERLGALQAAKSDPFLLTPFFPSCKTLFCQKQVQLLLSLSGRFHKVFMAGRKWKVMTLSLIWWNQIPFTLISIETRSEAKEFSSHH